MAKRYNRPQKHVDSLYREPLGNVAIDGAIYDYICDILPPGKTILELGSGVGTRFLVERWKVYSIEHNKVWLNLFHDNYIYAPMKNGWYNVNILKEALSDLEYELILVDGPKAHRRTGIVTGKQI